MASRVYDLCHIPAKTLADEGRKIMVVHSQQRGPLEFTEIDLNLRTALRVLQMKDIVKVLNIGSQLGGQMPAVLVCE